MIYTGVAVVTLVLTGGRTIFGYVAFGVVRRLSMTIYLKPNFFAYSSPAELLYTLNTTSSDLM